MNETPMAAGPPITVKGNDMEMFITGTGQQIWVHPLAECNGANCVIHNPSAHSMRSFPTHWRDDRKLMERICKHGVGHPDPDDLAFKARFLTRRRLDAESVHGCDGCCRTDHD